MMIYDFLNKLDPKLRDAIYSINEQDGLEFEYQIVEADDNEFFYCYKMTYIKFDATPRSLSPLERNIGFWTQA